MSKVPAPAAKAALAQATKRWPNRSKSSDGIVPSAAHTAANPRSDHEPGKAGYCHAWDLTHDPGDGCDCDAISRKLAASFVSDEPPPALVERLAARFSQTDGDLREVMRTLIFSPEFLDPSMRGAKFKTPYQYTVSAVRACAMPLGDPRQLAGAVARMGMPIFLCPTPDGWRDSREAWLNPEGLRQRAEFGIRLGGQTGAALTDTLSASLSAGAQSVMAGLPPKERVSMALARPDFMRR